MKIIKGNYTLTFLHCLGSFEKLMQKQIVGYIENVLSPYLDVAAVLDPPLYLNLLMW